MNWNGNCGIGYGGNNCLFPACDRVQFLQAKLFPVCTITAPGFLGSFLSNNLKTNQLEVNTDAQTSRSIARLKEPRDLFALPKERDHECPQQTARWPTECQVLDERIYHIEYNPTTPEPYYQPSGRELQPRPVGEENGVVIYSYNPISAVNYKQPSNRNLDNSDDSADEDDSLTSDSRTSSPDPENLKSNRLFNANDCAAIIRDSSTEENSSDEDTYTEQNENCSPLNSSSSSKSISPDAEIHENFHDTSNNNKHILKETQNNSNLNVQFSRSSVGGSKYLMNVHPSAPESCDLVFESRFESGNLCKAVKITPVYYELYLRSDMYTNRHSQWFYFRVTNTRKGVPYRLSIVNLVKSGSLYNEGMRPLMYSTIDAKKSLIGWRRCGENISYFKNDDAVSMPNEEEDDYGCYTLTFNIEFPYDNDTVYFAHSYPYTYSDLQDYLMEIQRHPIKSKYCKLRLLCRSLAGNNVYYLTVTAPSTDEETARKKRAIVVSARVHPGETPASWMMKGLMDFITGDSFVAKKLRHKFIFKLIPMLNPDGVIVGNTRSSLTGKDLNRQYRTVIRETYPSIWYTKTMIKRLTDECGVVMYCDMHAHSRKHNIFIYGCENKRTPDKKLTEQVFPLMLHKNVADKFSFESCKFKVQRNKEGTGRIVIWMLGVTNSYTMEASFGGSTLGSRNMTHFSTADYEHIGRAFCETLLDYSDENPIKVMRVTRIKKRLKKLRKKERRLRKAEKLKKLAEANELLINNEKNIEISIEKAEKLRAKIVNRLNQEGSNADEPLNIPLSDYSSDEGDSSSSSSENEGKVSSRPYEGPCCQSLTVPPSSPVSLTTTTKQHHEKKTKKQKPKSSHKRDETSATAAAAETKKHRIKSVRSVIELRTTEPDFDLLSFYTSDEDLDGYENVPKAYKNLLRAELKRSTLANSATSIKRMPPELIITPASNSGDVSFKNGDDNKSLNETELPPILPNPSIKRNHTWHSFKKCVPSIRITNPNQDYLESVENLQLKLSLKKQIWTGSSTAEPFNEKISRPLSWGIPPAIARHKKTQHIIDEHEDLLAACSQKLAAWQLESDKRGIEKAKGLKACLKTKKISKTNTKIEQKQRISEIIDIPPYREKKKKSTLTKIAETTQMLANLARSTKTSNLRKSATAGSFETGKFSTKLIKFPNKFKTGGIVATAVVQPTIRKSKKHRHQPQQQPQLPVVGKATLPTRTAAAAATEAETDTETSNKDNVVRKVKSKKKSKLTKL